MLSFISSLRAESDSFAIFVTEKYEYKDSKKILSKDISKKINLFLSSLKTRKEKEEISSLDISDIINKISSLDSKETMEEIKNKIRKELRSGLEKEKILDDEDAVESSLDALLAFKQILSICFSVFKLLITIYFYLPIYLINLLPYHFYEWLLLFPYSQEVFLYFYSVFQK